MEYSSCNYLDLLHFSPKKLQTTLDGIKAMGKKVAVLYGNCHMEQLNLYLRESPGFMKEYFIIDLPVIFEMQRFGITFIDELVLNNIDLIIYQKIAKDNKFGPQWASENILSSINSDCERICVPNTVFLGYFPQEGLRHDTIIKNQINFVPMFCGDKYIDYEYADTRSIKATIHRLSDSNHFMRNDVENNLAMSFRLLEMQDLECSIPMKDYVVTNYKDICLFTEPKHPTNPFFHEMTDRILALLGIDKLNSGLVLDSQEGLSTINRLFYPAVIDELNLKFNKHDYYIDKRLTSQKFSFEEFIEVYIRNACDIE